MICTLRYILQQNNNQSLHGSAKTTVTNNEVKEFYTPEEARKFTEEDFIKNPKLEEVIERSMQLWK